MLPHSTARHQVQDLQFTSLRCLRYGPYMSTAASQGDAIIAKLRPGILRAIFTIIPQDDCLIFLFGSYAAGDQVASSDVDIGVWCPAPVAAKDFLAIQEQIQNTASSLRKIDVVDFGTVDAMVKQQALRHTQLWHVGKNCGALLAALRQPLSN